MKASFKKSSVPSDRIIDSLVQGFSTAPEVSFAYLFGSFVSGKVFRDIDVALYVQPVLPQGLSEKLADLAGFRNVLVHIYWRLDLDRVHEILQREVETLVQFREIVRNFLHTEQLQSNSERP